MQKWDNYKHQLKVLSQADRQDLSNDFIKSGIIDKFSLQFELAWKVLKELLQYEGASAADTGSPRTVIKTAYAYYDFLNQDVWLEMLDQRNRSAHIYNGDDADALVIRIINAYIPEFQRLQCAIAARYGGILRQLP